MGLLSKSKEPVFELTAITSEGAEITQTFNTYKEVMTKLEQLESDGQEVKTYEIFNMAGFNLYPEDKREEMKEKLHDMWIGDQIRSVIMEATGQDNKETEH